MYIPPSFWPLVTDDDIKSKCRKSDFLGPCSFTQLLNNVEKLRRKPKIFVKMIQIFWYVQHVGVIIFFLCTRSRQSCTFGKSLKCWENLSMLGKPQGKKSSLTLDISLTAWAPPPFVSLDMFKELFFPAPYEAGKSSPKKLDFYQAPPSFLGKCSNFS